MWCVAFNQEEISVHGPFKTKREAIEYRKSFLAADGVMQEDYEGNINSGDVLISAYDEGVTVAICKLERR